MLWTRFYHNVMILSKPDLNPDFFIFCLLQCPQHLHYYLADFDKITISMEQTPSEANNRLAGQKFPAFYGTRMLITVSTRARHRSLSWARWIHSTPSHTTSYTNNAFCAIVNVIKVPVIALLCGCVHFTRSSNAAVCKLISWCSIGLLQTIFRHCPPPKHSHNTGANSRHVVIKNRSHSINF
jgi:hypothetical protein